MFNSLSFGDVLIIIMIVVGVVAAGFYFLNKWAYKKMGEQETMIEQSKQAVTIYVIDKKKDKVANANFPKAVAEQMPKRMNFMKVPLVKAKIGPQIMTLMCDKKVYEALPVKKNVKVEVAGAYIISMKGMKSDEEMKAAAKAKKQKEKDAKKAEKNK